MEALAITVLEVRTVRETEFRGFHSGDGRDVVRLTGPDGNARFRGGRWLTGSLVRWADGDTSILRSDPDDDNDSLSQYFVLPETVGVWTGFCDKNGRRIYEGDWVVLRKGMIPTHMTFWVEMYKGAWCVRNFGDMDFLSSVAGFCKVIGTVYDPEVTGDDRA